MCIRDRSTSGEVEPWQTLLEYFRVHFIQLGYLLALATPVTLVAHAIASVPASSLLWIVLITIVHTSFYRLLGTWLQQCQAEPNSLFIANALRVALVAIYICTSFFLPRLSHLSMSRTLTQPAGGAVDSASTFVGPFVLPFIVTYAALCALLCAGLLRQLSQQRRDAAMSDIEKSVTKTTAAK